MKHHVVNMACEEFLDVSLAPYSMIFADPPDNLGLEYEGYSDKITSEAYYNWLELVILKSLRLTSCLWLSYYWQHDLEIKHRVRNILKYRHPAFEAKTLLWRYTFGQHQESDCGSGFRYILRLSRRDRPFYTDSIRVQSWRQQHGDHRANPLGRVPDDVWDIPRVTGNSHERRSWHPTQHPEQLMERIVLMSTNRGEDVADLFGGTGTTLRVCQRMQRNCTHVDISKTYCELVAKEHNLEVKCSLI